MSSDPATEGPSDATPPGEPVEAPWRPIPPEPKGPGAAPLLPRCNLVLVSFLSLFVIGFVVWLVSAGKRYRAEYAEVTDAWRVGNTRTVEITIVRTDRTNLGCASDQGIAGLRCGYRRDLREAAVSAPDDPRVLQPFNTVGSELLLGANLWVSLDAKKPLPDARFTVACRFRIEGLMSPVSIRFDRTAAFAPTAKAIPAGTLTECTRPQ
jgi:hypothetical protein